MQDSEIRSFTWHARKIRALAETYCTRELTEQEQRKYGASKQKITGLLAKYGLKARFQGDPRGHVVVLETEQTNRWGNDGWGVI
jgi:hypothetical protein